MLTFQTVAANQKAARDPQGTHAEVPHVRFGSALSRHSSLDQLVGVLVGPIDDVAPIDFLCVL
jgi:hypothetical protein